MRVVVSGAAVLQAPGIGQAPKATRGRKAKAISEDETAGSTPAKGRRSKAAVEEETTDPVADLAQEPSVITGAPDQAE